LVNAPELPAKRLDLNCYPSMFQSCSKLNYIKALFTTHPESIYTDRWVDGVSSTGTFVKNSEATWTTTGTSAVPTGWTVEKYYGYLTFIPSASCTFKFIGTGSNSLSYSTDGSTWTTLASDTSTGTIAAGSYIMWKGDCTPNDSGIGTFKSSGSFIVAGNVMSLIYGDEYEGKTDLTGNDFVFYDLFANVTGLTSAAELELPATTLEEHCYESMFRGCTGLTAAPSLPATVLVNYCYAKMFQGCTSLTTSPELPSTTLISNCYNQMFSGCTSLNYIKALFLTTPSAQYTYNWVKNVAATGTFYKNDDATWDVIGVNGMPEGWTIG